MLVLKFKSQVKYRLLDNQQLLVITNNAHHNLHIFFANKNPFTDCCLQWPNQYGATAFAVQC